MIILEAQIGGSGSFAVRAQTAHIAMLGQSSAAYKIRRDCLRQGIPYLRYYYDHEGWWNTRAYVTQRTRAALNP